MRPGRAKGNPNQRPIHDGVSRRAAARAATISISLVPNRASHCTG
ncbi:hypothetical protein C7S16_2831 [Burkholderia thailandensis]|uniref:Uncharacterized protein n=1 Tax=Burkholderia thailandensis TaxID=57975 RepID=A0AAW9CW20_BURTH|nr:hypothetical protein [Burkholderia thailandensis]MDW9255115.1 hypothetical protein [Burkholderia thailandensis]